MALLTQPFLASIGVNLDVSTTESFNQHFEDTLSERVISEIVDTLEPNKIEDMLAIQDAGDEKLQSWLQQNVPDLTEIIEQEVTILIGEIAESSDQI